MNKLKAYDGLQPKNNNLNIIYTLQIFGVDSLHSTDGRSM